MNDHNLDDLIIENTEPKKNKTKSLLTIFALLLVVFIIAVVFTSVMIDEPANKGETNSNDMSEMISPELTLQNTNKDSAKKKELTEILEEEFSKPLEEPIVREKRQEPVKVEAPAVEKEIHEVIEEPKREVHEVKKHVTHKKVPVVREERTKVQTHHKNVSKNKYYIQVGAFSGVPSKQLLSAIRKHNFSYVIDTNNNGIKKVLIGPYDSRHSVDLAIARVRSLIVKASFVVKK